MSTYTMTTRRDVNKAQTAGNDHTTEDSDLEKLSKRGVLSRQRSRDARWNRKGHRKIKDTPSTTSSSAATRNADNAKETSSKVPLSTARSSGTALTATSMSPSSSSVLGISTSNVDIRRSNMDKTGSSESSSTEDSVDDGGDDGSSTSRSSETLASSVSGSSGTFSTSTGSDSGTTHRNKNASAQATTKTPSKVGGYGRGNAATKNKSERVWAAG